MRSPQNWEHCLGGNRALPARRRTQPSSGMRQSFALPSGRHRWSWKRCCDGLPTGSKVADEVLAALLTLKHAMDGIEALRARLAEGLVIPACPLALTTRRRLDEQRQRALLRYYLAAGVGGVAVGVHTTQFAQGWLASTCPGTGCGCRSAEPRGIVRLETHGADRWCLRKNPASHGGSGARS